MLGRDRPEKNSVKCLIRNGEIPSPRQTPIDKTNDRITKSELGALVRDSDPRSGQRSQRPVKRGGRRPGVRY